MKVLLDACIGRSAHRTLIEAGYDVIRVGEAEEDPGDESVLARAHREHRVLVTADKDFGELVYRQGRRHCGILRIQQVPLNRQAILIPAALDRYASELESGAFIIVQEHRTRVRLPQPPGT